MNPILLDFPDSFTTNRLFIRSPRFGDGKEVNEAIAYSINELRPWMPFAQSIPELEETEANIRQSCADFLTRKDLRLHIYDKEKGHFIGSTGLHRMNWKARRFEIGYWCHSKYSGIGYITEAVEGLIKFAVKELKANRIEICADSKNMKSRRIPENLGFTLEAILQKDDISTDGSTLRDTCLYSKTF
ncbi:GNAT family N-acetyltransferase [Metabacillus arenae]|uniref:GNAT family N-acetyltransferase n=1 Tax=Metabacillus arenae TaxID=2771434 RepID=A0A926NIE6_9BACI|nr:GNAT family N-acetyltransferase [Metabacillus arenae]MBD1378702.1 GNAT family N-acetyltransferase [Metabacillus arenae]